MEDIESIAEAIKGAKRYFIQKYNPIEGREDKPHAKQTAMLAAMPPPFCARILAGMCYIFAIQFFHYPFRGSKRKSTPRQLPII